MTKFMLLSLVAAIGVSACDEEHHEPNTGRSTVAEMEQTETNQARLARAVPPPVLNDSQERRNLVRRLELLNNPNRISYIHLLSLDGRVIFYTTVRGKVSSLNSLLTTPDQVITLRMPCNSGTSNCYQQHIVHSPDFDGSYGENPHGIFWFTEQNTYMEWNGQYFISDQPMRLAQPPTMTMMVDEHGTPVAH